MKKKLIKLTVVMALLGMIGTAQATLTVIGTATYGGTDYKLIYDDDDTGYGGGGLVWLDYSNLYTTWQAQAAWADGLGPNLTVTLNPDYTTNIDWTTGWRLPDTVDGSWVYGYEGDPDNDGIYGYTYGFNLANSEMGHLYYTELGNKGQRNTDGTYNNYPFPQNTGDFDNLKGSYYWSCTEYANNTTLAWYFLLMASSYQDVGTKAKLSYGLAVHSGLVSAVPVHPADLDNDNDGDGTDLAKMAQLFSDGDVSADDLEAFADAFGRIDYPS